MNYSDYWLAAFERINVFQYGLLVWFVAGSNDTSITVQLELRIRGMSLSKSKKTEY
jgi:hypothetical protein